MSTSAFTIKEFAAVVCCVSASVALLGASQSRIGSGTNIAICKNNVRIVTDALLVDAVEHNNRFLWSIPRNPAYQRGSPNVWENFIILSNYLSSPRVFVCPSDIRRPAQNFTLEIGGLGNPEHQNNSVSYFFSTDALITVPNNVLIGERSLTGGTATSCPIILPYSGVTAFDRIFGQANLLSWKPMLHGPNLGIISTIDGVVQVLDKPGVNRAFFNFEGDGNFNNHVLLPF